jgi:hypothetical protein
MHLHVLPVVAVTGERATARVAQVRPFAGVSASVPDESVLPRERLPAVGAREALLPVVESRVDCQVAGPLERFAASFALESPLVIVYPHVLLQTAPIREFPTAHDAFKSRHCVRANRGGGGFSVSRTAATAAAVAAAVAGRRHDLFRVRAGDERHQMLLLDVFLEVRSIGERFSARRTADRLPLGSWRVAPPDVLGAVAVADERLRAERAAERPFAGVLTLVSNETALVGELLAAAFVACVTLAFALSNGLERIA